MRILFFRSSRIKFPAVVECFNSDLLSLWGISVCVKAQSSSFCRLQENCEAQRQSVCEKFHRVFSILEERQEVRFWIKFSGLLCCIYSLISYLCTCSTLSRYCIVKGHFVFLSSSRRRRWHSGSAPSRKRRWATPRRWCVAMETAWRPTGSWWSRQRAAWRSQTWPPLFRWVHQILIWIPDQRLYKFWLLRILTFLLLRMLTFFSEFWLFFRELWLFSLRILTFSQISEPHNIFLRILILKEKEAKSNTFFTILSLQKTPFLKLNSSFSSSSSQMKSS